MAYVVKNVRPSFQGDALENGEHSQSEIIKIGDARIGTIPAVSALWNQISSFYWLLEFVGESHLLLLISEIDETETRIEAKSMGS